jgi:regulator of sigma E protease
MTHGQPCTPAEVGQVRPGSAAERDGIRRGDVILAVNGQVIERFEDVQRAVRRSPSLPMRIVVRRDGKELTLPVTPDRVDLIDRFGNRHEVGLLGIARIGARRVQG